MLVMFDGSPDAERSSRLIMNKAPILLLACKRPLHTKKVLESLYLNLESQESDLYAFVDCPKKKEDHRKFEEVIDVIKCKRWCKNVYLHESKKNRGCANQTIEAVSWLCKEKGRVIVLEDDILLSPFFLNYMNTALELYAKEEKVMDVGGYMFPIKKLSIETGFIREGGGWGWGTWERAWSTFERDGLKLLRQLKNKKKLIYEFNFRNTYNYYGMLESQVKGKIGGWDIRWYATKFLNNGLTLSCAESLTKNIGFDGTAVHTDESHKVFDTTLTTNPIKKYPRQIEESGELLEAMVSFFNSVNNRNILSKIKSRSMNFIKKFIM